MDSSCNNQSIMKEYEIQYYDYIRILFGEVPLHFYIEVAFRLAIMYLLLIVSMRIMGKRMSSQLSRNEMAAVASLAAAVGIPLMNPDKGILPAVVIAGVIITYQILVAKRAARNVKFESLTQDRLDILVEDGVLQLEAMLAARISRERIFAQFRNEGISHLGMVKRLYFEAGGAFSLLEATEAIPGLSVVPEWDTDMESDLHIKLLNEVCYDCGNMDSKEDAKGKRCCSNCGNSHWVKAVIAPVIKQPEKLPA
jgi:uncharacterized membrane protein YcaP (DUF421 family)